MSGVGQGSNVEGSYVHAPMSIFKESNYIVCVLLEPQAESQSHIQGFPGLGLDDGDLNIQYSTLSIPFLQEYCYILPVWSVSFHFFSPERAGTNHSDPHQDVKCNPACSLPFSTVVSPGLNFQIFSLGVDPVVDYRFGC